MVERIGEEVGRVGGDGRLVFLAGSVAVADEKTREEQRHADGGGAGVVGQQAGPGGVEAGVELGEMFERPEGGVRLGGIRVVEDRVGRGRGGHLRTKISGVESPREIPGEPRTFFQKRHGCASVRREVAERLGVRERKGQRRGGVVEAVDLDAQARRCVARKRLDDRHGIRSRAETDIPDHKRLARVPCPLDEPLLADVERHGFRHRADNGMEGLAKFPRAQTARTGLDGDDVKSGAIFSWHAQSVTRHWRNPQWVCERIPIESVKNITDQQLNLPAHAPVMVLPGASLFPNSLMPLHIFEPRYRAMLAWSLEQERMFCVAPMKPGISEARSEDDFHHTVGLGLVRACVEREDGTSHLMLQGLARVRLTGFLQDTPFRIAELRELRCTTADPLESELLTAKLLEVCAQMRVNGVDVPEAVDEQLRRVQNSAVLSDLVAHTFLRDANHRQDVFEELRVGERIRLLIRHLAAEMR